jgi:hypothetical protein
MRSARSRVLRLLTVPYFVRHPEQRAAFMDANFHPVGGLDAGNYGFVRLVDLIAVDCNFSFLLNHWYACVGCFRYAVLIGTALFVLLAKRTMVAASVPALLLAHFLTYQHVWEHHMSGVCALGALLLTAPAQPRWFTATVLVSLLILALPTPFALLDAAKVPEVDDPSVDWPWYGSYLIVLPKVLPTIALFCCAVGYLGGDGWISLKALSKGRSTMAEVATAKLKPTGG